jgi:hypothetical protein
MMARDSIIMANDSFHIEMRGWFRDGRLAILHRDEGTTPDSWSRDRLYFVEGHLLACSTLIAYPPGSKLRRIDIRALFDPRGLPLEATQLIDGMVVPTRERSLRSLQRRLESDGRDAEESMTTGRTAGSRPGR